MALRDKTNQLDYVAAEAVSGSNPGAGAEFSHTVPAGEKWLLRGVSVALAQAAAGSSQPILRIAIGGVVVFESLGSSAAQAVSTTCQYTWAPGNELTGQIGATTNVHSQASLPDELVLPAGAVISSVTIGLSANTDYAAPAFLVEKV